MSDPPGPTLSNSKATWWHSALLRAYESLTCGDSVQPVDVIFVMAGRMERKAYALELYRAGLAPRLLLSVGRFEVSRMARLDFGPVEQLKALRDQTAPDDRHFFITTDASGIRIERVKLPRWSTYGEAVGLHTWLQKQEVRKVAVISTDVHLRRTALAFAKVFRDVPAVEFVCWPVPSRFGFLTKDGWWTRPDDRRFVLKELVKLMGYRVILAGPAWARRRLMRLKD